MRKYIFFVLSFIAFNAYSQTDTIFGKHKNYLSISANYQYGNISPTVDFLKGDNLLGKPLNRYQSITLKTVWQNPGYSDWQRVFRCPYYGVGLTVGDFYDPAEVGYPVSLFGVFSIPIVRLKKLEFYSEIQYGLTGNWKHYDQVTNPKNLVVGGDLTFNASVGMNAFYPITKNLDVSAGVSYVHFSNGGLKRPNLGGFNIFAPNVGVTYHLADRPNVRSVKTIERLEQSNDLYVMACGGIFQSAKNELDTTYYAMEGLSVIYFTQLIDAFRLGYGADLNYCYGLNALPDGRRGPHGWNNCSLGFIVQPEIVIDRLTLIVGIGIYALNENYKSFNQFYQRWGVRYELYKNLSVGLNLRAVDFTTAEYMEFNAGYRFRWIK